MLLLLRTDAGERLGVGHAVRCVAVAEAAAARRHQVRWCGRLDEASWLFTGAGLDDPSAGAVLPAEDDPARLAALARDIGADALHVDHYGLAAGLRGTLNTAGIVLSNVEDATFGRRPADVVVDPTLGAEARARPEDGSTVLLRGLDYALLRAAVRDARDARPKPAPAGELRVVVVMGGTDAVGLLDPVLASLAAAVVPGGAAPRVDVIVPAGREVTAPAALTVRTSPPRADLPRVMAQADLVISAAGNTVWELCCVGAPMALVRAADNQAEGYRAVVGAGAAAGLGGPADLADVAATADTLRTLLRDRARRESLSRRAAELVDGWGADRVVAALEGLVGVAGPELHARPAHRDDAELLFAWRNDDTTRRWSRSPERVDWADHLRWVDTILTRPDRLLLVIECDGAPVGTVRWDRREDACWEVSITIAPERRGHGLAGPVLRCGEQVLAAAHGPAVVVRAQIHQDNSASRKLFARAGYLPDGPPDSTSFTSHRKQLDSGSDRIR